MQNRDLGMKKSSIIHAWALAVFTMVLVLDQWTKYLIRTHMSINRSLPIIPGFFDLVFVLNKGGAFGILSSHSPFSRSLIFIGFSMVAILALLILYWKSHQDHIMRFGIVLLMSGAIGNLIDRLRWGMVVDFLDFYVGRYHWPAFNVADMVICIGLGLVFLDLFLKEKKVKRAE